MEIRNRMQLFFRTISLLVVFVFNFPHSAQAESTTDRSNDSVEIEFDGSVLKAFNITYQAFKSNPDFKKEERNIENYRVFISQDTLVYVILFHPKKLPGEETRPGGRSKLGRDVEYRVGKKDFKIVSRVYFK